MGRRGRWGGQGCVCNSDGGGQGPPCLEYATDAAVPFRCRMQATGVQDAHRLPQLLSHRRDGLRSRPIGASAWAGKGGGARTARGSSGVQPAPAPHTPQRPPRSGHGRAPHLRQEKIFMAIRFRDRAVGCGGTDTAAVWGGRRGGGPSGVDGNDVNPHEGVQHDGGPGIRGHDPPPSPCPAHTAHTVPICGIRSAEQRQQQGEWERHHQWPVVQP